MVFDGEGRASFKSRANDFLLAYSCMFAPFVSPTVFPFFSYNSMGWYCVAINNNNINDINNINNDDNNNNKAHLIL